VWLKKSAALSRTQKHRIIANSLAIQPADNALCALWPLFVGVVSADGDLGAAPIALADLVGEGRGAKLAIVVEHARSPVEETIKDELKVRLGKRARPDLIDVRLKARPDRARPVAELRCYLDLEDDPAIELGLIAEEHAVRLVSRVRPAKFWLARKKTQAVRSAAKRLEALQPAFRSEGDGYVRECELAVVAGDLRDVVADAMADEVRQVIGTGLFDHDL
jgi:hypothetical protein